MCLWVLLYLSQQRGKDSVWQLCEAQWTHKHKIYIIIKKNMEYIYVPC